MIRNGQAAKSGCPEERTSQAGVDGFTLMELLVAIALVAIISGLLVGAITNARTALQTVERTNTSASVFGVRHFLEDALAQTRALPQGRAGQRSDEVSFSGAAQSVSFITNQQKPGQFAGFYKFALSLRARGANPTVYDLVLAQSLWRPPLHGRPAAQQAPQKTTLINGVRRFAVKYYGSPENQTPARWHSNWQNQARLPQLVSIKIELAGKQKSSWPPLIVRLQLAM